MRHRLRLWLARPLVVFSLGLVALTAVLVVALSRQAYQRVDYNHVPVQVEVGTLQPGERACQPSEVLIGGTRALRMFGATTGTHPQARLSVLDAGSIDGNGGLARTAPGPSIVASLPHPVARETAATVCLTDLGPGSLRLDGAATGPADQIVVEHPHGPPSHMAGRVRIDDLIGAAPGSSWRVLGHLPGRIATATGTELAPWLAGLGGLLTLLSLGLLLRRSPAASRRGDLLVIAALALSSGALWAGLTPALEKTDETAHFAYVQAFSELGHPPTQFQDTGLLSNEFACWYNGWALLSYRFYVTERPYWVSALRQQLDHKCAHLSRRYDGAMYHAYQPPLYYGLGSVAYLAGSDLPLPTRLMLVRLVSVLIAAALVVVTYLLIRELLPNCPWAARAGALAVALQPVVMFNLSGVNPDGLYSLAAAIMALLAARAWRRGLTAPIAVGLGAAIGFGLLSKTNFLSCLPAAGILLAAVWWCGRRRLLRQTGLIALSGAVAGALFGLYALINHDVWNRGLTYTPPAFGSAGASLHRLLSFTWQFFLPRLPGMHGYIGGDYVPFWNDFVRGILTRLGWWDDYGLASIWILILLGVGALILVAAVRYLWPFVRRRPRPVIVGAVALLAYLGALVYADYRFSLASSDGMEGRYLLPAIPVWGAVVGAAIASIRPSWRPTGTALLAVASLAYVVLATAATVNRFYL